VTIGSVIEDGFYHDFSYRRPFTPDDLAAIERAWRSQSAIQVERTLMPRDEAVTFKGMEHYKAEIIASIPEGEPISLYRQDNFTDLCRGPHVPSTGRLKVFKLMKVAGAYWRGDSRNEMLQRVYGTAWVKKEDQDAYLHRLEEAEKRDHRRLGRQLDLFHMQDEAGNGVLASAGVGDLAGDRYMRDLLRENGYLELRTPQVIDVSLWKRSGHCDNFRENMFATESESRDYAVKPMNCPGHVQVFNQGIRSYRDLPLRLAEFGACHRNEPSGALHGLMRVRGFVQDDAHIFCSEAQIEPEVMRFIDLLQRVYADFGFDEILVKLSTRPPKRVGADEVWDRAETGLQAALEARQLNWQLSPGEGAFYGPKI
jgi:threonyl-tRNA synthetase